MRGLYPIVDLDMLAERGVAPLQLAEAILTAQPPLMQLRAKLQMPRTVLPLLMQLKALCARAGTQLFVNDRPDLALLAGADGVHVGQEDLPVEAVRKLPGQLRVGVSTHDHQQLAEALAQQPDYVAFGPIFRTRSKRDASPELGLAALRRAAEMAQAAEIPLVAIGGLTLEHAATLGGLGVVPAVISDLLADGADLQAISARAAAWQAQLLLD